MGTLRSLQSFQERVTIRRKRKRSQSRNPRSSQRKRRKRRNQNQKRMSQNLRRSLTPLRRCPREPLTWKNGRGFTPTMMNQSPSSGSGNTLTMRTTPSGGEITNTMMNYSCNLIGGMFQRLDKLNKNAFASVCLFGQNNDSTISGIWVFKGHELAFELDDN